MAVRRLIVRYEHKTIYNPKVKFIAKINEFLCENAKKNTTLFAISCIKVVFWSTEAISIRTDGRTFTLYKGYSFRSVFIVKCKHYFIVIKIYGVDKIINQSLFILFIVYFELSKSLYPKPYLFLR